MPKKEEHHLKILNEIEDFLKSIKDRREPEKRSMTFTLFNDATYKLPDDFSEALRTTEEKFEALKKQLKEHNDVTQKLDELTKELSQSSEKANYPPAKAVFEHGKELLDNFKLILNENSNSTSNCCAP